MPSDLPSVRDFQEWLNALGAGLVVDGRFGPRTRDALRKFQIDRNGEGPTSLPDGGTRFLRTDGCADVRSIEAVRAAVVALGRGDA